MPSNGGHKPHPPAPALGEFDPAAYIHTLVRLEQAGERSTLIIGPYSAFALISALQLTLRHPSVDGLIAAVIRDMIGTMLGWFAGTPGETLLSQGDDPANDMTKEEFAGWLSRLQGTSGE